jgi:oleate hydratase
MVSTVKAYLVGSGIGSLSAAAFMIRDGAMRGENILILESEHAFGGSLDAAGDSISGYSMRGGRMFTADNYECTWNLFKTIPSLNDKRKSVYEETIAFNEEYESHALARLVDRDRAILPVISMGFSMQDREQLLKLVRADETTLGKARITDWIGPTFFGTNFWYMWSTTFAFQPWHSAVEFRRYLHRFLLEFSRIDTLAGVKRTVYNQYDSLVRPLKAWLLEFGVGFWPDCCVTDLEHRYEQGRFIVSSIQYLHGDEKKTLPVDVKDLVFVENGSMTDASSVGSMTMPPPALMKASGGAWTLWEKLAAGNPAEFGDPGVFNSCIAQSWWGSFTVTLQDAAFFDAITDFSGNDPGTGGLMTFKDSQWLLSIVLPHQPHFPNQASNTRVFWGYALFGDRIGNFVAKSMAECNGADILKELCGHLRFDLSVMKTANCIPCRMPYITSQFMPRMQNDRPLPVPAVSGNLAFIGQFVEIADDCVFTVEYSVRSAQMSVYQLLRLSNEVPPVTSHDKSVRAQLDALLKAFK